MADNNVQYTLSLKDLMTSKLKEANIAASALESTMSILGVAAGAFAGIEFLKGSVEAFNESEQASAQLDASLRSTGNAANLNREALDAQALALMNTSLFDDDAITHTQGLLATFTNIKDAIYMDAVPAIADLATKMGGDLQGATIQVGKALNDPTKGLAALGRVGVSFSQSQKDVIEKLQATGHMAEAQKMILAELHKEFGGSAKAASEAGTGAYTVLQHQMGNVREEIGGMVVAIGNELLPMFHSMVDGVASLVHGLKDAWHWVKENKDIFKALAVGIGIAITGYVAYLAVQKAVIIGTELMVMWTNRQVIAENALTLAQYALNLAMELNPIGLVIGAIAALGAAMYYAYEKVSWFHAGIFALWEVIKTVAPMIGQAMKGLGEMIMGVLVPNPAMVAQGWQDLTTSFQDAGQKIGQSWNKGYALGMADFATPKTGKEAKTALSKGKTGASGMDGIAEKKPDKAKGSQAITINISINKLIETFKVQTTNIQESTGKIQELVANTLLAAVNDASITANI